MTVPCSKIFLLAAICATTASAQQQNAATTPAWTVTGNVTLASQYISRGVRQSWGQPALQGGVDALHASGWSFGTWASTVSSRFIENGKLEWDLYGGYTGTLGALGYSATLSAFRYPGARIAATATRYHYGEAALGVTYGAFYARYHRTVTRDFFGIPAARGTAYLDLGANHDMGGGYTVNAHLGEGRVAGAGNAMWNWRDARLGVTRSFAGGWNAQAALARARGATSAYDAYTTGVPDAAGRLHISDPLKTSLVISSGRTF